MDKKLFVLQTSERVGGKLVNEQHDPADAGVVLGAINDALSRDESGTASLVNIHVYAQAVAQTLLKEQIAARRK